MHSGHGEAGRESHRMLLADTDVEEAIRKLLGEVQQPGRRGHGGGDGADFGPPRRSAHERIAEDVGVGHLRRAWPPGQWVEGADAVELVDIVFDRWAVPMTLLGDDV